jgi:hypothetical protein
MERLGEKDLVADTLNGILRDGILVRDSSQGYSVGKRIFWKDLAERYNLQYRAELNDRSFTDSFPRKSWPRYLVGPDEGSLNLSTCTILVEVLSPHCPNQDCYSLYDLVAARSYLTDVLHIGALDSLLQLLVDKEEADGRPTYWWPKIGRGASAPTGISVSL